MALALAFMLRRSSSRMTKTTVLSVLTDLKVKLTEFKCMFSKVNTVNWQEFEATNGLVGSSAAICSSVKAIASSDDLTISNAFTCGPKHRLPVILIRCSWFVASAPFVSFVWKTWFNQEWSWPVRFWHNRICSLHQDHQSISEVLRRSLAYIAWAVQTSLP